MRRRWIRAAIGGLALACGAPAIAAVLTITAEGRTRQYTSAALLGRRDVATITLAADPAYPRPMTYRAVPLRALLSAASADTLEARATDGFVAQLPASLIAGAGQPYVAVEDPAHPWPRLPAKTVSAGPFYLIWRNPAAGRVSPEQWPYALAALTAVVSPARRWPAIAVAAGEPAASPLRRGQAVFEANCLACHRLAGSGEGTMGPDLLRPMPATAYLTAAGLRALIRDPAGVRTWPGRRMPAFPAKVIPDADVDAVAAYLHHLAGGQSKP